MPKVAKVRSAVEEARMQREVRQVVCSAPWFEACWAAVTSGRLRAKQRLAAALDAARIYPPGGDKRLYRKHFTQMRRCSACGAVWYPPQYVRVCSELCEDCIAGKEASYSDERTHRSSTSSPSAAAIHELQHRRQRLLELPLAADDEGSLLREIAEYQRLAKAAGGSPSSLVFTKKHDS